MNNEYIRKGGSKNGKYPRPEDPADMDGNVLGRHQSNNTLSRADHSPLQNLPHNEDV